MTAFCPQFGLRLPEARDALRQKKKRRDCLQNDTICSSSWLEEQSISSGSHRVT